MFLHHMTPTNLWDSQGISGEIYRFLVRFRPKWTDDPEKDELSYYSNIQKIVH